LHKGLRDIFDRSYLLTDEGVAKKLRQLGEEERDKLDNAMGIYESNAP
jgi:hypothetical protein